jgi:hypothetical protein
MKYKININRRKKEKTKKIWLPEDLNLGVVAVEPGRLSIGIARGSSSLLCHQLYLTRQRAAFHPRSNKAVSPRSSPKSTLKSSLPFPPRRLRFHHRVRHHHHLGPISPLQSLVVARWRRGSRTASSQPARATRSGTQRPRGSPGLPTVWWCAGPPPAWGEASLMSRQGSRG